MAPGPQQAKELAQAPQLGSRNANTVTKSRSVEPVGAASLSPRREAESAKAETAKTPMDVQLEEIDNSQKDLSTDRCSVYRDPGRVLVYAVMYLSQCLAAFVRELLSHPVVLGLVLPALAFYLYGLYWLEGPHVATLHSINITVQDVLFWFVLGVASSIGFGSGMHSGILFLFPHIYKVCMAADVCGNLNFGTNVFLEDGPAAFLTLLPIGNVADQPGYCECDESTPDAVVPYWHRVAAVMFACVTWGAGTAVGEIPPYYIALKARAGAARQNAVLEAEAHSDYPIIEAGKQWTIDAVEKYGFVGVFLLAAWPNALFDLCGLACGAIGMPFFTFFTAVFLGKAVVKVGGQACFFVLLFTRSTFEMAIASITVVLEYVLPGDYGTHAAEALNRAAEMQLENFKNGHHQKQQGGFGIATIFNWVVFLFIAHFFAKALEQFAIDRERELDAAHLEHLKEQHGKKHIRVEDMKPREDVPRRYWLVLAAPIAAHVASMYLGRAAALSFLYPVATLLVLSVFVDSSKITSPLDCAAEYPLLVLILGGVCATSFCSVAMQ